MADELVDAFPAGAWFVSLSRLTDPALVVPTSAHTLGQQEVGSRPIQALLREWVRTRRLLLLLDNCEQVLAAASEVADLLANSSGLVVLATSRVPLRLRGEREVAVLPLALPPLAPAALRHQLPAERLTAFPAVALFMARAAQPDFALTDHTASAVA